MLILQIKKMWSKLISQHPKSIIIAWAVIILLYNWLSTINCTPGPDNSNLISTEKAVPIKPENNAYIKYNTPISLAFEDKNHLSCHKLIPDFFTFKVMSLSCLDKIILLDVFSQCCLYGEIKIQKYLCVFIFNLLTYVNFTN